MRDTNAARASGTFCLSRQPERAAKAAPAQVRLARTWPPPPKVWRWMDVASRAQWSAHLQREFVAVVCARARTGSTGSTGSGGAAGASRAANGSTRALQILTRFGRAPVCLAGLRLGKIWPVVRFGHYFVGCKRSVESTNRRLLVSGLQRTHFGCARLFRSVSFRFAPFRSVSLRCVPMCASSRRADVQLRACARAHRRQVSDRFRSVADANEVGGVSGGGARARRRPRDRRARLVLDF